MKDMGKSKLTGLKFKGSSGGGKSPKSRVTGMHHKPKKDMSAETWKKMKK